MGASDERIFRFLFSKGDKRIAPRNSNSVLLMNTLSMKTLKYNKDSLVLLHTEQGQLLFRCWPCTTLESSALLLTSRTFFQDYLKEFAYCGHYNSFLDFSDVVILNCDIQKPFIRTSSFEKFIKTQLDPVYIREGLKFNVTYMGYPCCLTVTKIYSSTSDEITHQKDMLNVCTNLSLLNVSEDNSVLNCSVSESSTPFCSTPKHSVSRKTLPSFEIENAKQFYCINSNTKIVIEKFEKPSSCLNQVFLHHLGGLKDELNEITSFISPLVNQESIYKEHSYGAILVGASGSGKTTLVQAVCNEYQLPVLNVNEAISGSTKTDGSYQFKKLYNEVIEKSPCILLLDGVDNLLKNDSTMYRHNQSESIHLLSTMIYDLLDSKHNFLIIGIGRNITSVDASLRKHLEKEIYFKVPSVNDRKEILNKILDRKHHNLSSVQVAEIAEITHSFTGGDLRVLCDKADISSCECITFKDIKETLKQVKPSSMAEFVFEIPKVKWSDIGGMHDVKIAITEMVDWPLKHAKQFKNFGITPSRGILMYGPPGCSKTMIAKALVSESHLNFISIKGPQLFNKYVGESEKAVSELFKKARSAAPCVIFFDEIDSLTSVRGSTSGNSNVSERILTQLLIEIDGIDVLQGVSIIAATNRPDMIDPSFLRPGRFDQMIYVPLPDASTRKEIFEAKLKNMPHDPDIDIAYLVEVTEGYTGAEITDLCCEAAMSAIKEYIASPSSVVIMLHFLTALKHVVPRTSKEMIKFYENYSKRTITSV